MKRMFENLKLRQRYNRNPAEQLTEVMIKYWVKTRNEHLFFDTQIILPKKVLHWSDNKSPSDQDIIDALRDMDVEIDTKTKLKQLRYKMNRLGYLVLGDEAMGQIIFKAAIERIGFFLDYHWKTLSYNEYNEAIKSSTRWI